MNRILGSKETTNERVSINSVCRVLAIAAALLAICADASGGEPRRPGLMNFAAAKGAPVPDKPDAVPGEILVKFKPDRAKAVIDNIRAARNIGVRRTRRIRKIGWHVVELQAGHNIKDVVMAYRQNPDVLYAEPNYRVYAADQIIPNDTRFGELWGMHNTGQTGGTADADIDAPEAWHLRNASSVVVAVIDTGVDYNHADLAANIWANPGEIPGNGVDDDGNGYVDDVRGWDFFDDDNNPMDEEGHGTHCSGTIGAVGNNSIGVAGVCWSVTIMPLRFLGLDGGSSADAADAIAYAIENGAKVLSNSWGSAFYSVALAEAVAAADAAGALFVAAAGNNSNNNDHMFYFPSGYDDPNVISVAATDHRDRLASFSSYGHETVDLGAPGKSILSTLPGNSYAVYSGTSMATPHVAGACALVWAEGGPSMTHIQVKAAILAGADPVPNLDGRCVTDGRLNVSNSLGMLTQRVLILVGPNGGERLEMGGTVAIEWSAYGGAWDPADTVRVECSANAGADWATVPAGDAVAYDLATLDWDTSGRSLGSDYLVRVTALADPAVTDSSDGSFTLTGPLDHFTFVVGHGASESWQPSGQPIFPPCTLTAKDAAGTTIDTFGAFNTAGRFPVTISAPGVTVTGLAGGGATLDPADLNEGVADLARMGMILTADAPPATVQLTASSADGKTGLSGNVTITSDALPRQPFAPNPRNGAEDVPVDTELSWMMGGETAFRLLAATWDPILIELQTDPVAEIPIGEIYAAAGLDFDPNGVLYGASDLLFTIDPTNGSTTTIGGIHSAVDDWMLISGIAFHPNGTLYGVDVTSFIYSALCTIDPATGFATEIGIIDDDIWGIDFAPDGTLYGARYDLVTIDPGTAQITSTIGTLAYKVNGIDFAPDGSIYAVNMQDAHLYQISPTDASQTVIGTYDSLLMSVTSQPLAGAGSLAPSPQKAAGSAQDRMAAEDLKARFSEVIAALKQRQAAGRRGSIDAQKPQPTLKSAATQPAGPATSATTASALTYDIYFGTDNPPTTRIAQDLTEPIYDPTPSEGEELDGGTTYYWYAVAKSAAGNVAGPLWLFTTVPPPTVLLSVESTPITGVSITGDKSGVTDYTAVCITGENVSLAAPATTIVGDGRYDFVQWTGDGVANGQDVQVTMDADKTVVAEYALRQHTLSVNSTPVTGAAITGTKPGTTDYTIACEDGEAVNLTAPETVIVSAVEYRFVRWIVDGADQPLFQESLELAMDAGHTAVAKYRLAADTNDDCMINVLDLIAVRNHLQESVVINDNWQYDVNDDQMINVLDLLSVRNNLQTMCGN